jgi:hypothetical protein
MIMNKDLPKLLRAIAAGDDAKVHRHDIILNVAALEIEQQRRQKKVTPAQIDTALENVLKWLARGQDGEYRIEEIEDDTLIYLNGCYSLRMIVLHALEGALP